MSYFCRHISNLTMTSVRLLRPLLRSALPRHTPAMSMSQGPWSRGSSDAWSGGHQGSDWSGAAQSPTMLVPIVIEQTGRGERSYDIYSRYRMQMMFV